MRILLISCLILLTVPCQAEEKKDYQKLSRAELSELFLKDITQKGIINKIKDNKSPSWQHLSNVYDDGPDFYGELIKKYIGCYPEKSYFKVESRYDDFFVSTGVPSDIKLIDERYLITGGVRQNEAGVKGLFLFDLQEKEAVISLLNYEDGVKAFVDIYVSPTAPSETVAKGVELTRQWIHDYINSSKHAYIDKFPPFTLTTSTCSN